MSSAAQLAATTRSRGRSARPPILVTGAPRSGTTFLGTVLSLNRDVSYIYEPMSRLHGLRGVPAPLLYVRDGSRNEVAIANMTRALLAGRGTFRKPPSVPGTPLPRALAKRVLGSQVNLHYHREVFNPFRRQWLIKDPWAAFASEWLHRTMGGQTVVIVRHPVPTVSSYQRLGWDFKLPELLAMDELMADHLQPLFDGVDLASLGSLESAAMVWRIYYRVLARYIDRNPDMIVVRHEDLSTKPTDVLSDLYGRLGLKFDDHVREKISELTGAGNQVEGTATLHQLQRDSAALATSWRTKVSAADRDVIRSWVEPESSRWYSDEEW